MTGSAYICMVLIYLYKTCVCVCFTSSGTFEPSVSTESSATPVSCGDCREVLALDVTAGESTVSLNREVVWCRKEHKGKQTSIRRIRTVNSQCCISRSKLDTCNSDVVSVVGLWLHLELLSASSQTFVFANRKIFPRLSVSEFKRKEAVNNSSETLKQSRTT